MTCGSAGSDEGTYRIAWVMGRYLTRAKKPSPQREAPRKPKEVPKVTLQDRCRELRAEIIAAEWAEEEARLEEARRPEYEALMYATFGPNWRPS